MLRKWRIYYTSGETIEVKRHRKPTRLARINAHDYHFILCKFPICWLYRIEEVGI